MHRVIVRRYDDQLRELGITVAQLDVLETLLENGGTGRPVDLGNWLLMDRSTVTRNIARLEGRGLVTTGAGPTGRERQVAVTEAGRLIATEAQPAWAEAQRRIAELLGPDGVRALDVLVQRVNAEKGGG